MGADIVNPPQQHSTVTFVLQQDSGVATETALCQIEFQNKTKTSHKIQIVECHRGAM